MASAAAERYRKPIIPPSRRPGFAMSRRPFLGLTLDSEPSGGFAATPWYALRRNYAEALVEAGGLPVLLPHHPDLVGAYLDRLDGVVISGGAFDIDPALYGAPRAAATRALKPERTAFELALVRGALERNLPLLGICGGAQVLAVALGGTLIQHLAGGVAHEGSGPADRAAHSVTVVPGSRLAAIVRAEEILVNSTHHQAIANPPPGLVVSARAADGVIEAIEVPGQAFCLGVQWHPEYRIGTADHALLAALVETTRR